MKKLFQFALLLGAVSVVVWLTREKLLPTPHVSHEHPPHYRSTPPPPPIAVDDLTEVKGIGPIYAAGLGKMGITTFRALSEADPQAVAAALKVASNRAAGWITQARTRNA
jgi:predicted flap endonuclease-1-like 5' DNA nuclease